MEYTVIFDKMPKTNPFKIVSEFGTPVSISTGNANHILDLIEEAIEEGAGVSQIEAILESRYDP